MRDEDRRERVALVVSLALSGVLVLMALSGLSEPSAVGQLQPVEAQAVDTSTTVTTPPTSTSVRNEPPAVSTVASSTLPDSVSGADCILSGVPLGYGSFGDDVFCLQESLATFEGPETGLFDDATLNAVTMFQGERGLRVDGVVGRLTGTAIGIWPPDSIAVVRTPTPPPGATDLLGFPLSSVAVSGPDAPPLPPDSGSGRRLVYDRAAQRVWAVESDETVVRSWLVSGSRSGNELPGTHTVYSRSRTSVSRDGESSFSYMVRWLKTDDDAIGFHSLPRRTSDGSLYQTEDELGIPLSSGCQRQADSDAEFAWKFSYVGMTVVVL